MPLQNFVDNQLPTIKAAWLNIVDVLTTSVFASAATPAAARTAIGLSAVVAPTGASLLGTSASTNNSGATVQAQLDNVGSATGGTNVGFLQSGAGAVPRTVQAKERDIVSVKDFGAVGDGVTDDTAAIVAWLAVGGRLYAPRPTVSYKYTSNLTPVSNSEIYGDGDSTVFKGGANCKGFTLTGLSNVVLRDFKIDGNRTNFATVTNDAIFVDWTGIAGSNIDIDHVTVRDPAGAGIIALAAVGTPSSGLRVNFCDVQNTGAHGIIAQDYISDVEMTHNKVKNSGLLVADRPCITASRSGSNVIVSDNIVVGSPAALGASVHGISIDTTTNATCQGNNVRDCIGYGIEIGFVTNGAFTGNTINNCTRFGIGGSGDQASASRNINVSVTGNTITGGASDGINFFITGGTGTLFHQMVTISGNTLRNNAGSGVLIIFADRVAVTGNSVSGNTLTGIYMVDCKNHFIDGNTVVNNNVGAIHSVAITEAGAVVTVVDNGHGYATNDIITIFGANPADYNGSVTITKIDNNSYTYPATAGLASPAVGTIQATKPNNLGHAGIRVQLNAIATQQHFALGTNFAYGNGNKEYFDVGFNGAVGLFNDAFYLKEGTDPRVENLTSAEAANIRDRVAVYMKNNKIVFAYDNAGAINYASLALDGATIAWVNSAVAP